MFLNTNIEYIETVDGKKIKHAVIEGTEEILNTWEAGYVREKETSVSVKHLIAKL